MSIKNLFTVGLALTLITGTAFASDTKPSSSKIVQLALGELRPTQPAIGFDQVYYKLGRFKFDEKKLYDELCEVNGQQGVADISEHASPNRADSFSCNEAVGSHPQDMKTVVIAPNGQYYLTDGHHTFNVFWQMPSGGAQFKVHVAVEKDYRNLSSMAAFWQAMAKDGNVWLSDPDNQPITPAELPTSLGLKSFANDRYRSLMYFSRDVAWNKPNNPIPFLEFYWTKELRKLMNVADFDLASRAGMRHAITTASQHLLAINTHNVGGSGLSATDMGQFSTFKQEGLDKLLRKHGKVDYMLRYKTASSGNGLAYDQVITHAPTLTQPNTLTLQSKHSFNAAPAALDQKSVNVIVEIPTGTLAKWELDKADDSRIIWEIKNEQPRIVNYLGYPGNYGTIPRTALPKEQGGDGDPLDVLILGQPVARGAVVSARLIGVMQMLDDGEQDDKLIAVLTQDSPFANVNSLTQLNAEYPGVSDIVTTWFTHYKGVNANIKVLGWQDEQAARAVLEKAQASFL